MECIGRFCELVRQNLGDFTFDDKRLALEALRIKVWVDGNEINIEGAIPVAGDDIVSTTLRCSGLGRAKADIVCIRIKGRGWVSSNRYSVSLLPITHNGQLCNL